MNTMTMKKMTLGLLGFLILLGSGTAAQAADPATPSSSTIKTQIQQLRDQGKQTKTADQTKIKQDWAQMKAVREKYQAQMTDLKKQRQAAVKSGNKDQLKAATDQLKALKKQRREEMKPLRDAVKTDRAKIREDKKAFRGQVKDLKKQKKS